MSVLVAQLGARMHYAVPRILFHAGCLEHFFTDFSAAHGLLRWLNVVPRPLRPSGLVRLLARGPREVPSSKLTAFNRLGWQYARRRRQSRSPSEQTAAFLWSGRELCRLVNATSWANADTVFTFNSAGLETIEKAKREGLSAVMEQTIAPRQVEQLILTREFADHPDWQSQPKDTLVGEYSEREAAEWATADAILCGSKFVVDGIRQVGGPAEKCVVVPYGVGVSLPSGPISHCPPPACGCRPLRVLTVGAVGLRKGAPYVLEVARQLQGQAELRWVGGVELLPEAEQRMAEFVDLRGSVPSALIAEHFQWADVFLLPSLCEGSATVTYEALAHGLPVICTPNTGSVVRHGVDGFIVPVQRPDIISHNLRDLHQNRELLSSMSVSAKERAAEFTLEAYGQRLLAALKCVTA